MAEKLALGAEAPNFDLTSTEDVVLMLRDEVPRMAVVLYFFGDPADERVRADLTALARAQHGLTVKRAVILGISRTKIDALKAVQSELGVRFPLLFDDRDFSSAYGVDKPEEGESAPALFVVDRDQKIIWMANPVGAMDEAVKQVEASLQGQPAQTYHYPTKVVNRVVNWWVNKVRPRPA